MSVLSPPFVASDRGDVYVYEDLGEMCAAIEAYDAPDMDLFDATGRPLSAVVDGYTWTVDPDRVGPSDSERLEAILRRYFGLLPEKFPDYAARAATASSLEDLIKLRRELAREPAPGLWARLLRRSWG